jgi:DNA repair photolyase
MNKTFKGKAIYCPKGAAGEYSKYAANFYVGCSAMCSYCYNRHGITAKVLGADTPTLKKCLKDEDTALQIFIKEADLNRDALRKHGLFFNFVSDPFLKETIELNMSAILYCLIQSVPVKTLTKQTWWLEEFLKEFESWTAENLHRQDSKHFLAFGFTLTGRDDLEPGASTNEDRIRAIKVLNDAGFKTWASIEPIIDFESSINMINEICNHVDLVKIGLQSGKKYILYDLAEIVYRTDKLAEIYGFKVYYKDSFVKQLSMDRSILPDYCVNRDYNIFES